MPFAAPPPPRQDADSLRRQRGFVLAERVDSIKSETPPPAARMISAESKVRHQRMLNMFSEMIGWLPEKAMTYAGQRVTNMEEWLEKGLPPPSAAIMQKFLTYMLLSSQGREGGYCRLHTLRGNLLAFSGALSQRGMPLPGDVRAKALDFVSHLGIKYNLSTRPQLRAQLSVESLAALKSACMSIEVQWSMLERLQVLAYIAVSVQTGLRPNPIIGVSRVLHRGSATAHLKAGAVFGEFTFGVRPSLVSGGVNRLFGHFTPRWNKTEASRRKSWPLLPRAMVDDSGCLLILLLLAARGGISTADIQLILDPKFCTDGAPREVKVPSDWANEYCFVHSKGRPVRGTWMNRRLAELSIVAGFEELVTTYCFRHFAARSLEAAGVEYDHIMDFLGHKRAASTAIYLGRRVLFDVTNVLLGENSNRHIKDRAQASNAKPNWDAPTPKSLDDKDEAIVQASSAVILAKRKLEESMLNADPGPAGRRDVVDRKRDVAYQERRQRQEILRDKRSAFFQARASAPFAVLKDPPQDTPLGLIDLSFHMPVDDLPALLDGLSPSALARSRKRRPRARQDDESDAEDADSEADSCADLEASDGCMDDYTEAESESEQ